MNPIFAREWRSRWREARSYWLLLALVLLLGLASSWIYNSAVGRTHYVMVYNRAAQSTEIRQINESLLDQASRTGRSLFQSLALGDCFVCLFLAPALAAPVIARERERGLLESLQMSHLRPTGQILARYLSSLTYLLALQVATLPMYGIVLFLGGVSPGELGAAALLIILTLLLGAAVGLWFSARSYRPSSALFGALVLLAAWSAFSWVMASQVVAGGPSTFWISALHPAVLMQFFIKPQGFYFFYPAGVSTVTIAAAAFDSLRVMVVVYAALIALLLSSAIRKVNAPLPISMWQGRSRWIGRWKSQLVTRREAAQARRERAHLGEQVQGALVADLPIEKLVRFRDPLLSREVKGRFRLRKAPIGISLLRFGAFLFGIGAWLGTLFALCDPLAMSRATIPGNIVAALWGLGIAAASALSATSFAREKESGTWEGLRLALLRPHEIVRSKWLSVLISFAYYSAPLWLLLPVAVLRGNLLSWGNVALTLALALASMGAFCSFGLWVSWRAPHPTAALTWSLGVAFALLVALPQLEQLGGLERQITFARYGVAPWGNSSWQNDDDERERVNWFGQSQAQSSGLASHATAFSLRYDDPRWNDFGRWQEERKNRGRTLWLWCNVWQPTQTFALLYPSTSDTSWNNRAQASTVEQDLSLPLAWVHLLLATSVCLVFLWLVRREVARERE